MQQVPRDTITGYHNLSQIVFQILCSTACKVAQQASPNFFLRNGTNSTVEFWPKCEWTPNFIANRQCLTTPLKLQTYQDRANSNCLGDLQSFRGVVKRCRNAIKFSVHSHFGQNFTVEFVPVLQKKLGWPTTYDDKLLTLACTTYIASSFVSRENKILYPKAL